VNLSQEELERIIEWGRRVFVRTSEPWSIVDDDLFEKLQRALRSVQTR